MKNVPIPRIFPAAATLCVATVVGTLQPLPASADGSITRERMAALPSCEAEFKRLARKATDLQASALAQRAGAVEHAEKYKMEIAVCEMAKKANSRPQLEACLALLDRAEARAAAGNQLGREIAGDTGSLAAELERHNRDCPGQQVRLLVP